MEWRQENRDVRCQTATPPAPIPKLDCSSCTTHGHESSSGPPSGKPGLPRIRCSAYPADRPPTRPLRMPRPGASAVGGLSSRASPRQPTTARKRLQGLTTCFRNSAHQDVFSLFFLCDLILIGRTKQFWVATYFARVCTWQFPFQFPFFLFFKCNVWCVAPVVN